MTILRPYEHADADRVTSMLVEAFYDDPGYEHAFPERRRELLRFIMPRLVALRNQSGTVRVALQDERIVGSLSASPSTARFGMLDYLRQGLLRMPFQFGWDTTQRMLRIDQELLALRNTVKPTVHHQYLAQLACHPDAQGQGVGTALMRAFLEEDVDPGGQHAVLLTSKSENVIWYEKFGFEIAGQAGIDQAFTAWCLVREPR